MKFVTGISKKEMDEFVLNHPFSHYMKTSFWAEYKASNEHYDYEFVGVKDGDKLQATAVLLKKRMWFSLKPYLYIPTGMCVDYNDESLFHFFTESLVEYAKKQKVSFLRIDPNVLRCHRDIKGELIDDGFNNEYIAEYLKSTGFFTKGYGYAYNGSWINRYTLKIDLRDDLNTIVSRFNRSKQNVLKRQPLLGIRTRFGNYDELHYLVDFEWDLTKTQGFKPHKVEFFEELVNILKDNIHFYITEIDLSVQRKYLESELAGNKYKKDPEARASKEKELENVLQLQKEYGDLVVIACGLFVRFGKNSWDLYTYMRKAFNTYNATDNLHLFVIQDMKDNGVEFYDMVGFSGVTKKTDPYYGLYAYKSSFGPEFYEHLGEFDYPVDEKAYSHFKWTLYQIKRVRRKIFSIVYKKTK